MDDCQRNPGFGPVEAGPNVLESARTGCFRGQRATDAEGAEINAALPALRKKTDRNDARGIPEILRTGWFSPFI
ncbi:MAG: hypothetical protein AAGE80_11990 [Pseudomonadota bacterium]